VLVTGAIVNRGIAYRRPYGKRDTVRTLLGCVLFINILGLI